VRRRGRYELIFLNLFVGCCLYFVYIRDFCVNAFTMQILCKLTRVSIIIVLNVYGAIFTMSLSFRGRHNLG